MGDLLISLGYRYFLFLNARHIIAMNILNKQINKSTLIVRAIDTTTVNSMDKYINLFQNAVYERGDPTQGIINTVIALNY